MQYILYVNDGFALDQSDGSVDFFNCSFSGSTNPHEHVKMPSIPLTIALAHLQQETVIRPILCPRGIKPTSWSVVT